jgi:hypothetical protein
MKVCRSQLLPRQVKNGHEKAFSAGDYISKRPPLFIKIIPLQHTRFLVTSKMKKLMKTAGNIYKEMRTTSVVLRLVAVVVVLVVSRIVVPVYANFHDEKSAAICGTTNWYKEYIQRHRDMMAGKIEAKYLISFPVKAGLADMILGYVSGFLWSLITKRVFLILRVDNIDNLCNQRTAEFGLDYRFVNWSSFAIPKKDYECMLAPYPEKAACTDPSYVAVRYTNNSWSAPTKSLQHLRKVNNGFRDDFKEKDMTIFPEGVHDANILMFSTNWGITYNAFHNSHIHDPLAAMGFTTENIFPCLFEFLFKVKPEVCSEGCKSTEQKLHALGRPESKTLRIGIHVRKEDASEAPEHFQCAEMVMADAKAIGLESVLMLVTASASLQEKMLQQYGDKLLLPQGKVGKVQGVHRWENEDTSSEGDTAIAPPLNSNQLFFIVIV